MRLNRIRFAIVALSLLVQAAHAAILSLDGSFAVRILPAETTDVQVASNRLVIYVTNTSGKQLRVPTGCMRISVREDDKAVHLQITIPSRNTPEGARIPWPESSLDIALLEPEEAALLSFLDVPIKDYSRPMEVSVEFPDEFSRKYGTVSGVYSFTLPAFAPPPKDGP